MQINRLDKHITESVAAIEHGQDYQQPTTGGSMNRISRFR